MLVPVRAFFFNAPPTTELYTLSLHDALPISPWLLARTAGGRAEITCRGTDGRNYRTALITSTRIDRKSTRLNSSHSQISYAVFCLKKKNKRLLRTCHSVRRPLPRLRLSRFQL